jgi:hypothetical protein
MRIHGLLDGIDQRLLRSTCYLIETSHEREARCSVEAGLCKSSRSEVISAYFITFSICKLLSLKPLMSHLMGDHKEELIERLYCLWAYE